MSARVCGLRAGTGGEARLWPVLLLLLAVVLVPTACLLWLMTVAIRNERLAVRQRLGEAYRGQLYAAQYRLEDYWRRQGELLDEIGQGRPAAAVFQRCVEDGLADSVVCYDAQGQLAYPTGATAPASQPQEYQAEWDEARRLEGAQRDLAAAADSYLQIAQTVSSADLAARAMQGGIRCLVQAGQIDAAVAVVTGELSQERYRNAVDEQGRLIAANAELMALQLMRDPARPEFPATAERLSGRLADYDSPGLAAAQRRFLMRELQAIVPATAEFPTLAAEDLAARFVETDPVPRGDSALHRSQLPNVWRLASPSGRVVALLHTRSVLARADEAIAEIVSGDGVNVGLLPPGENPSPKAVFDSIPAGSSLPGWQLALSLEGGRLSDTAAERTAFYLWTGIVVIAAVAVLAVLIANTFRRQLRLTRLKSDLLSTVSHELKTPLASIRLLVDTLLDQPRFEEPRVREYLQLAAKENARLSRLIDNFLTFSRMERGRHAFEFGRVSPAAVVQAVQEALGERFQAPQCRFELEIQPDLPPVLADADALVAAVLNLLDNAYKYSGEDKQIVLRSYARDGSVCFEVADNGIGLSPRAAKRVFKRFYQVDRRLSRQGGGVGLGLSIVEFIVAAHGGTVAVASQPGKGSTFTVAIPVATVGRPAAEGTPS